MATWPWISFGKTGRRCWPMRRVSSAFQINSRKNVRGLKCLDGVKSLNERGNLRRGGAGRCETGFVIRHSDFNPFARQMKWKITCPHPAGWGGLFPKHCSSLEPLNLAQFLGALASRRRVPVFGSRLAGGTPTFPNGSWGGRCRVRVSFYFLRVQSGKLIKLNP